jgi:hypothetical protein
MPKRVTRPLNGQGSFSRILRTFRGAGVSNSPGSFYALEPSEFPKIEFSGSPVAEKNSFERHQQMRLS